MFSSGRGLHNPSPGLRKKRKNTRILALECFFIFFFPNVSNAGGSFPLVCSAVTETLPQNVHHFQRTFQAVSWNQRSPTVKFTPEGVFKVVIK